MKTSRVDVFWYCFKIIKQYTIHCLMRSIPISGKQRYYQKQLVQKCSYEKVFWKYASNLQENTHFGMGVLQKICHIFQEHHFIRTTMEGCFCFLKYRNCLVHVSSKFSDIIFLVLLWLITSAVAITTAQPYSSKPEFKFYARSNPVRDVSEIHDGEDLWQMSRLEIRLNAFRWSTIPQNNSSSSSLIRWSLSCRVAQSSSSQSVS